jgi:hypothetical protein
MRSGIAAVLVVAAVAGSAAADSPRAGRPRAVSGGLSLMGIVSDDVFPFLTASAVFDQGPSWSLAASVSYFTSDDRVFGPRVVVHAGGRHYLRDERSSPFAGATLTVYHELDVDYQSSDRSQQASTAVGGGASIGHELVTDGGLSWTAELAGFYLIAADDIAPHGLAAQLSMTLGYRF